MGASFEWAVLTLQRHPRLLRGGLSVATALLPRRLADKLPVSADAVHEVFARPEDFWMGSPNAPKLKVGRFLLGMDPPSREYAEEKQLLRGTLEQLPAQVARFARVEGERLAEGLARERSGTLDLVGRYAVPAYTRALAHGFGVPTRGAPCPAFAPDPNQEPLAHYLRTLGTTIGSDHPAPFGLEAVADEAAPYFRAHLQAALRAHRDGKIEGLLPRAAGVTLSASATVMGQLIAHATFADGDAGIVRNVAGMMSASAGFPRAFTSVLHELLLRPDHLRGFAAAIRADDEARVYGYVREALRFRPVFPMLVRRCPHATTLRTSGAAFHAAEVVPFFPCAAMFDSALVHDPHVFNPQRPESGYFVFGGGPRECIGKALMMSLFPALFAGLLRRMPNVLAAAPGRFRYRGAELVGYELRLE